MTWSVYEVEMEAFAPGQRLCQHIMAISAAEAGAKVHAIHGQKIIAITVWRECTQDEIDAAAGRIHKREPVPFNPDDWKDK